MLTLSLGLIAALAWGVHDLCVRYVSQSGSIYQPLITVQLIGLICVSVLGIGTMHTMPSPTALMLAVSSGGAYALAGIALYKAFSIGPVRLVAPIIGAYPVLSIAHASLSGSPASPAQWLAVVIIIAGVTHVVRQGPSAAEPSHNRLSAILWALAGGTGFAVTFALGQKAAQHGDELLLQIPTRLSAILVLLAIALALRAPIKPSRRALPIYTAMGFLDGLALGVVSAAGGFARPEFASVSASAFGLVTVVLAALVLGERMRPGQWGAVAVVFAAIGFLGF